MDVLTLNILDKSIIAITAYQALIFAVVLFLYKKSRIKSKRVLGYYMILNFTYYAINFFYYSDDMQVVTVTYYIIIPVIMLLQPFFYFYIKSLTNPNFKCSSKQLLHFAPAIVVLFMNVFLYSFLSKAEQIQLLSFSTGSANKILNYYLFLHKQGYHVILSLQALIYFGYSSFLLYKHKKQMTSNFSNTEGINLNWIITLFIIFISVSILHEILGNIDKVVFDINARISYNVFYMLTISFIGIGGFLQKEIYNKQVVLKEIDENIGETIEDESIEIKYKNSSLNDDAKRDLVQKLKIFLKEEKPYLNNDLKLDDIASALDTNRQYLSQIINETYKKNFYTLINTLRVEEAKKMFVNKKHKQLSIMGVANSVGFNSKSTFNSLFKKYNKQTPSQFIKENRL